MIFIKSMTTWFLWSLILNSISFSHASLVGKNSIIKKGDFDFKTVVDILSENVEFSTFLNLVQSKGCIPYLNELKNFTLFAPVNSAFAGVTSNSEFQELEQAFDIENHILHHGVLNLSELNEENNELDSFTNVIYERQNRFALILKKSKFAYSKNFQEKNYAYTINEIEIVDPDLTPNFQNAIVQGISKIIQAPPNLISVLNEINHHSSKKIHENYDSFIAFLKNDSSLSEFENLTPENTLLLPSDTNINNIFNLIEFNYLADSFNNLQKFEKIGHNYTWSNDRQLFMKNLIIGGIHGGNNRIGRNKINYFENLNHKTLQIEGNKEGSTLKIDKQSSSNFANVLFENSILHSFSNLNFLNYLITFNAEKYLHGMNSTAFVEELKVRNLHHLISNENLDANLTIFVPVQPLSDGMSKSNLLYHFVEDQIQLEDIFNDARMNSVMLDSSFCSSNKKLGGNCQRLKISRTKSSYLINDTYELLHSKPIKIGNTLIYKISDDMRLPPEFLLSINPFYQCSNSLSFLKSMNLLNLKPNNDGYTVLLPCFDSWSSLDLNLEYLKSNITAQELLFKGLIFNGLIYSDASDNTSKFTTNLLNENVRVTVDEPQGINSDLTNLKISQISKSVELRKNYDILFNQGVIHPLTNVYFPDNVKISVENLIRSSGTPEFLDFLNIDKDASSFLNGNNSFTFLVPTSSGLNKEGIFANYTRLRDFLKLHTITGNSTKNLMDCEGNISTMLGKQLICTKLSSNVHFLTVKDAPEFGVRILKRGCSTSDDNSCILLIDKPISLQWLSKDKYLLHLPGVAIGLGVLLGALAVLVVLGCILLTFIKKDEGKLSLAIGNGDSESSPLLNAIETSTEDGRSDEVNEPLQRFESSYSSNSVQPPKEVRVSKPLSSPTV